MYPVQTYIRDGIIDEMKVIDEAEARRREGKTSVLHYHAFEGDPPCNEKCRIIQPDVPAQERPPTQFVTSAAKTDTPKMNVPS